ncbi:glycosyltransferase [Aliarcobacter butzleri]|uniref:glycosyltransferase n=1 Tax=Aliarcobacter butzleri TaxID=28197 RepID=UPI001EDA985F|nr:glycosyltransferase [Aliarcobacter butzleri]MCG3672249.1 glycosyltransferase [Aliarcobacter butzleri]
MELNVLMISIGDNILSNSLGDALERQKEYASALGHVDMIVFSPKVNNFEEKHYEKLSIYPTKSKNMFTFIYDVVKIAKNIFKTKKIDIITTQDPFGTALSGYILKKIYGIPLHIQNHSCFLDNKIWINEKPILFTIFNKIAHFTLKRADRLRVVNSQEKYKYINILGINEDKIDVSPVPVNTKFWQQEPIKDEKDKFLEKYNIDDSLPILSWAGRPVMVKNFPYLFKVISNVSSKTQINFLVAGDMKHSYWDLNELEKKYNIKPIYLGILSHEELKVMYYLTDIYLHTSNYEGFGLVVSDAQACGTVVIATDTAGIKDIIDKNNSGYLVIGDEESFSNEVIKLLKNKNKLNNMKEYTKKFINEKFNKDSMFKNVVQSIKNTKV